MCHSRGSGIPVSYINTRRWIPAFQSVREQEKMDYMRFNALHILLININFWIPAFAGMTKWGAGMTGSGHFRTDCFAGMTPLFSLFFSKNNYNFIAGLIIKVLIEK